jgi:hypothetical protein
VTAGTSQSFSITPNSGYIIADVRVNNASVGAVSSYTFSDVRANQSILASFAANEPSNNRVPDQPVLLFPLHEETDVSLTPLIEITGFSDPDSGDGHGATRWQIATDSGFENLVLDIIEDSNNANGYLLGLVVPQGTLSAQSNYFWRAMVKDDRNPDTLWSDWSSTSEFTTTATARADVNANGVPDDIEPEFSDLDADGQNDNDQPLMRVFETENQGYPIGIKAAGGIDEINCFAPVDPGEIPESAGPYEFPYGLMSLNVRLGEKGGKARVEIFLPENPDSQSLWFKYDPVNGWYQYPVIIEGGRYVLEIYDGGYGDADGIANGVIVDPIGMTSDSASFSTTAPPAVLGSSGSGGGGCFIASAGQGASLPYLLATLLFVGIFGFGGALWMRKRRGRWSCP